jgi:hypothetical protein
MAQWLLDRLHIFLLTSEEGCKRMAEDLPSDALVDAGGHRGKLQMMPRR